MYRLVSKSKVVKYVVLLLKFSSSVIWCDARNTPSNITFQALCFHYWTASFTLASSSFIVWNWNYQVAFMVISSIFSTWHVCRFSTPFYWLVLVRFQIRHCNLPSKILLRNLISSHLTKQPSILQTSIQKPCKYRPPPLFSPMETLYALIFWSMWLVPLIPKLYSRTALGVGIFSFFFCVFDHLFEFDCGFIPNTEEARVTMPLSNHCISLIQQLRRDEAIIVCMLLVDPLSVRLKLAVSANGHDLPSRLTLTVPVPWDRGIHLPPILLAEELS